MKFGWRPDMPDHRDLRVTFDKVDAPSHITKKSEGVSAQAKRSWVEASEELGGLVMRSVLLFVVCVLLDSVAAP